MVAGLVDLPTLLQQASTSRRTGVLTVRSDGVERRLHLDQGVLVAIGGTDITGLPAVVRAACWSGVVDEVTARQAEAELLKNTNQTGTDSPAAQSTAQSTAQITAQITKQVAALHAALPQVASDGWLDAGDAWFEEQLSPLLAWHAPALEFIRHEPDHWEQLQIALGWSGNLGGLLLECLRRQDELASVVAHVPAVRAVLVATDAAWPEGAPPDAVALTATPGPWIGADWFAVGWIPPYRVIHAAAWLLQSQLVCQASAVEALNYADARFAVGDWARAAPAYEAAAAGHAGGLRPLQQLAELAESAGYNRRAAEWQRSIADTAGAMGEVTAQVMALRRAMTLGADAETALGELIGLYRQQEANDEAIDCLFDLARVYEAKGNGDAAMVSVREAQALGADPVASAMLLARLAAAAGDEAQSRVQLEQAARLAQDAGRRGEALAAWDALAALEPGRCDWARAHADLLQQCHRSALALERLRGARLAPLASTPDAILAGLDERIVAIDPDDHAAHDRLAQFYQRSRDRDGAMAQLRLAASAQERAGDLGALIANLEKILIMGGAAGEDERALANAYARAGIDAQAESHWLAAADRYLADGELAKARTVTGEALLRLPASVTLRARMALAAERDGDRKVAIEHYHRAAQVALGTGDRNSAQALLVEVCRLRPDLTIPRIQLAEVFQSLMAAQPTPEARRVLDRLYREVIRVALQRNDQGTALDFARRRAANAEPGSFSERLELVRLLNRLGHTDQELIEGRKLLDDLFAHGDVEAAAEVLSHLVVSRPADPELSAMLADAYDALGNRALALRSATHAASLFQAAERSADADRQISLAQRLGEDIAVIDVARILLSTGQPIDWAQIRADQARAERQRLAENIGSGSTGRDGVQRSGVRTLPGQAGTTSRVKKSALPLAKPATQPTTKPAAGQSATSQLATGEKAARQSEPITVAAAAAAPKSAPPAKSASNPRLNPALSQRRRRH